MEGAGCADGDIVTKWINDFIMDLCFNEQEAAGIPNAYQLEAQTERLREAFERQKLIEQDQKFCAEQVRALFIEAAAVQVQALFYAAKAVHQPQSEAAVSQSESDHQSEADPQSEAGATQGTQDEPADPRSESNLQSEIDPQDEASPFALIAKTAHPRSFQTFYGADSAAWFLSSCDGYESP